MGKLRIPDLTANELRSIATAKFVLTTHEMDVAEQDLSRIEPTDEVKTLREAMDSPDWPIWEASIKKDSWLFTIQTSTWIFHRWNGENRRTSS